MTPQDTKQISIIVSCVISLIVAVLTLLGYNIVVVQPAIDAGQTAILMQQAQIQAQDTQLQELVANPDGTVSFAPALAGAAGDTNLTNMVLSGDLTVGDDATLSDDVSITGELSSGPAYFAAPTAVATATPALFVNTAGVSNLFELRKNATPVVTVGSTGAATGISLDTSSFLTAGTFLTAEKASTVALGANGTITALGTYQPITSTAAVTTSTSTAVANGTRSGDLLILINANASDAIVVDGAGGNVECGGNVSLGAKDSIALIWDGSDWRCWGDRNN